VSPLRLLLIWAFLVNQLIRPVSRRDLFESVTAIRCDRSRILGSMSSISGTTSINWSWSWIRRATLTAPPREAAVVKPRERFGSMYSNIDWSPPPERSFRRSRRANPCLRACITSEGLLYPERGL
jgi:hypothetical protein